MPVPLHRRDAIRATLATLAAPVALDLPPAPTRGVRAFRLIETAGLRRFGYPIASTVPDAVGGRNFRLIRDGRTIPAQFRQGTTHDGRPVVTLDFLGSPGPMEVQRYEVHFGPEVEPGPEPRAGLTVDRRDETYLVKQGDAIGYAIPAHEFGDFREAGSPRLGYLQPGGSKLLIRSRAEDGLPDPSKPVGVRSSITRQGPLAVGLRFESGPFVGGSGMTLGLTFPASKTWIEASLTVDDPAGRVSDLGLDLGVMVEGAPTLVDLGAGTTIYGQIKGDESMALIAGRALGETKPEAGSGWIVRRGSKDASTIQAVSTADDSRPAEGWAHVMDARRCVALAVAGFGQSGARDKIQVGADGRVLLQREFAVPKVASRPGPKTLSFWLHFVPMPVQVGAATSPRSILSAPKVEWDQLRNSPT